MSQCEYCKQQQQSTEIQTQEKNDNEEKIATIKCFQCQDFFCLDCFYGPDVKTDEERCKHLTYCWLCENQNVVQLREKKYPHSDHHISEDHDLKVSLSINTIMASGDVNTPSSSSYIQINPVEWVEQKKLEKKFLFQGLNNKSILKEKIKDKRPVLQSLYKRDIHDIIDDVIERYFKDGDTSYDDKELYLSMTIKLMNNNNKSPLFCHTINEDDDDNDTDQEKSTQTITQI